jgi:1-acyl-sn-glycerol-3-phosphate acyltransferase
MVRVAAAFVVIVCFSLLLIPLALVLLPWRVRRLKVFNVCARMLAAMVIAIAGVTLRVRGREKLRESFPAIYVTNHVSAFDVFIGMRLCPTGGVGVMASGVKRVPGYGQIYSLSGHAMMDRKKTHGALSVLHEVAALVRNNGLGIWILPEGGRSNDGRLQRFKTGFVSLAIETGLPVVPVVLHDVHRVWSRKRFPTLEVREIDVDVLPPVDTTSWRLATRRQHAEDVRALFAAALGADQKPVEAV